MTKKSRRPKQGKPPPKCKALLLCERVVIEQETGSVCVMCIFNAFGLPKVPAVLNKFYVFLQVIDGIGRYEFTMEIHDLQEQVVVAKAPPVGVRFTERPNANNLVFPVVGLPVTHEGAYDLVIFAGSQEIDRQRFDVFCEHAGESHETNDPSEIRE